MQIAEFFAKYEADEEMVGQILAASKDETTLRQFLSDHGVELAAAAEKKKEMSDEELSHVSGGGNFTNYACLAACALLEDGPVKFACKMACTCKP